MTEPQAEREERTVTASALASTRARRAELMERVTTIDRGIPDYAVMPTEEIAPVVDALLTLGIKLVNARRGPNAQEREVIEGLARHRAQQGVSASGMFLATQLGVSEFLRLFDEEAQAAGISTSELLRVHDHVWELSNTLVSVLSSTYHEHEVQQVRAHERARIELVRALTHERLDASTLASTARTAGLDPDGTAYLAIYTRIADLPSRAPLEQAIARAASTDRQRAVVVVIGDELIGIAPRVPELEAGLVGAGTAGPLAKLPRSFQEARGAYDVAAAAGANGVVTYAALGPLPLLLSAGDAADALDRARFSQLDAEGASGAEVARTVASFLDHDQHVDATAAALHVHRNTVHYRLRRFRELTGLDLGTTDDLLVAWWLLARRRIASR